MKRLILTFVLVVLLPWSALAATMTFKQLLGSSTTLLTTELNSLASNAYSSATPSVTYDNTIGQTGDGATACKFELFVTFASAPTANTSVIVWLVRSYDGTNFEPSPTSSIAPGSALQLTFAVNSGQTITRGVIELQYCPTGKFKAIAKNDGTGQTMAASGNTLKITPIYLQGN